MNKTNWIGMHLWAEDRVDTLAEQIGNMERALKLARKDFASIIRKKPNKACCKRYHYFTERTWPITEIKS